MVSKRITVVVLVISFLVGVLAYNKTVVSYEVEALPDSYGHLGEGPHWDVATQNLYMVDLKAGKLKRFDYKQKRMYKCQIENETFASFIIPIEGFIDKFAVGIERRIVVVRWDGFSESCKVENTIITVEQKYDNNRFNDAKCDPVGRLFAGTMPKTDYELRTGNLYKVSKPNAYEVIKTNAGISNGLAWNEKIKKFYYIDSEDYNVKEYDYDINTGDIKNPKVIFDLGENEKNLLPDGMTIDSEGLLYIAMNGGSAVFKIDPKNGQVLLKIEVPINQVTSVAFGGPYLDILYVTTADETSPSGRTQTYEVTGLGVKGLPMNKYKLQN